MHKQRDNITMQKMLCFNKISTKKCIIDAEHFDCYRLCSEGLILLGSFEDISKI